MAGGAFIAILVGFGLGAGAIGKIKGSSFFLWFLIGFCVPFAGLIAAILWRNDRVTPKRRCPECNNVVPMHDQVCMRCGRDLDWPQEVLVQRPGT